MKKVLIANRGEIARRVIRTLRKMDIATVAIYSDADRNAPHVLEADESVYVGQSPSSESYLRQDVILQACKDLGVDGIHPGYGFLSENAGFARKVKAAGITFIGPSPEAMDVMGDKLSAKQAVKNYDVPLVPGVDEAITNVEAAKKVAQEVGFPILIKASAGGGGKGMRLVNNVDEFEEQMKMAQSEARSSFGDDAVFIEKFVTKPRHIEIQVFADKLGNTVYLFERECSIQRRHQKVIEEAPSAVLTPELRKQMGEAAVKVCEACKYEGAGTVEFLLDADLNFYFLEMNTRLQVEHPVTEEITGTDLVEWQVRVARGERLPKLQDELTINGHSLEVRVYAEDTLNGFIPDIGKLKRYRRPSTSLARVDDAFEEGMEVPIYYDPMIAKLIVHAPTREEAIDKMIAAIDEYQISGLKTTLDFGKFVMKHEAFRSGDFDTNFVKHYFSDPTVMWSLYTDENEAFRNGFKSIWADLKEMDRKMLLRATFLPCGSCTQMNEEKEVLKRSRIIFGALGAGQLMFLVISLVTAKEKLIPVENTTPDTWLFPGIAVFIALAVFLVYRQQLNAGLKLPSREARLKAYPAVQIIRFVGIESGTLLLIVALYTTHQFVLTYLAVLWLFIFFTLFPATKQFEKFLNGGREVYDR